MQAEQLQAVQRLRGAYRTSAYQTSAPSAHTSVQYNLQSTAGAALIAVVLQRQPSEPQDHINTDTVGTHSATASAARVVTASRQPEWAPVTTIVDLHPRAVESTALSRLAAMRSRSRGSQSGATTSSSSIWRVANPDAGPASAGRVDAASMPFSPTAAAAVATTGLSSPAPIGLTAPGQQSRQARALAAARALDAWYTYQQQQQQQQQRAASARPHSTTRAMALPSILLSSRDVVTPAQAPTADPPSATGPPIMTATAPAPGLAPAPAATAVAVAAAAASSGAGAEATAGVQAPRRSAGRTGTRPPWGWPPPQLQLPAAPTAAAARAVAAGARTAAGATAVRVGGGYRLLLPPTRANTTSQPSRFNRARVNSRTSSTDGSNGTTAGSSSNNSGSNNRHTVSAAAISTSQSVDVRQGHSGAGVSRTAAPQGSGYGIITSPFAAAAAQAESALAHGQNVQEAAAAQAATMSEDTPARSVAAAAAGGVQPTPRSMAPTAAPAARLPALTPVTPPTSAAPNSTTTSSSSSNSRRVTTATTVNPNADSSLSLGMERDSSVTSLQELLEAIREGYSLLPTTPRLTGLHPTGPAVSLAPVSLTVPFQLRDDHQLSTAETQPAAAAAEAFLAGVDRPHPLTPSPPAAGAVDGRRESGASSSTEGTAIAAATAGPANTGVGETAAASADSSHSSSSGNDADVLMAIQLLTESLQTLRETDSLIDSMLEMGVGSARQPLHPRPPRGTGSSSRRPNFVGITTIGRRPISACTGVSSSRSNGSQRDRVSTAGSEPPSTSTNANNSSSSSSSGGSSNSTTAGSLMTCVVCMEAQRSVLLLPCKHLVLCGRCFGRVASDAAARHRETASFGGNVAGNSGGNFLSDLDDEGLLQRLLHPNEVLSAPGSFGENGTDTASTWMNTLPVPTPSQSAAAAAAAGGAQPAGLFLGRLGAALARQALADAQQARRFVQHSTAQRDTPIQRRRSSHREWLGQIDYHWWAQPVQPGSGGPGIAQPGGPGLGQSSEQGLGLDLAVWGVGMGRGREVARMSGQDGLSYGALVRCPICRATVEGSVSDVLIV